jgi:ATP-dependent DNA ligase
MAEDPHPRDVAAAWQPQRPGKRGARDIADAIVEPDWGGMRVVAALTEDEAALYRGGGEVVVPDELLRALLDTFSAIDAVVEGHVTTAALRSSQGVYPTMPKVERPPILVPRAMRKDVKDDPFVRARDYEAAAERLEPTVREALERGERHAFVATDLLWLDGQSLLEIPLLERRRLLEGVLDETYLVRRSTIVRPSAVLTLVTWGALGFRDLSYRAANSRYLPGLENPDWAIARAPDAPQGMPKPVAPR